MIRRYIILVMGLVLIAAIPARAQVVYGQPAFGNPQLVYSHWSLETDATGEVTLSQWYMPLFGFVPLQDNLELQVFMANSSSSLETQLADVSLSGLSDVRLQLNRSFADDRFIVSGGVNLPTGKTGLSLEEDNDEWLVVEFLSMDFLDLPLRRMGDGFGFNLLFGGATQVGEARIGGGLSYRFNGEYKPYENSADYDPGDVFNVNGGGELQSGNLLWSANVMFTSYSADVRGGTRSFKQAPQLAFSVGVSSELESYSIGGGLRYLSRGRSSVYDSSETIVSQLKHFGNEFGGFAQARFRASESLYLMPSLDVKLIAENEIHVGSASIVGFGGSIGKEFSEQVGLDLNLKYYTGSANGGVIDLSGYQIAASLMARL